MEPILMPASDGETITDRAERTVKILVDEPELTMTWSRLEAGEAGADPHVHREHADAFYVVEGEIEFGVGPETTAVRAPAGSALIVPPNVVHTFDNTSDARAVYLNFHSPNGGFAEYMRSRRDGTDFEWDSFDPPPDGGRPASDAVVTLPGEGDRFDRGNRVVTILASLPQLSLLEIEGTPEWDGVDPHKHDDHLDGFFVLEGEPEFLAGNSAPGTVFAAPRGVTHGIRRPASRMRVLNFHCPDSGFAGRVRAQ